MASYRIVCTQQEPANRPPSHAHIVTVGTGSDPNSATEKRTLAQVIQEMNQGHSFYTQGVSTGKVARVEKYTCQWCKQTHIRSVADAVADNNLDNLRSCSWR